MEPLPDELETADNNMTSWVLLTVQGDINGDHTVDILDAIMLANHFGLERSDSLWNPNMDLNEDGIMDILDAVTLVNTFGNQWA